MNRTSLKERVRDVCLIAGLCVLSSVGFASAQGIGFSMGTSLSPVLTLDQDRMFSGSLYGQHLQSEFNRISQGLARRNQVVSAELAEEEKSLTEQRATLSTEEFRVLADAFDEKVVRLREEQDARIRALQNLRERERLEFSRQVVPVLLELLRDREAVAILDERALVLALESFDVTDEAISRIDAALGDGGDLVLPDLQGDLPEAVLDDGDAPIEVPAQDLLPAPSEVVPNSE